MRAFVIFVGFLLLVGGGAVAGAQYAPIDLATISVLDNVPGSREFLTSQMALYAGGGAAAFGFLLMIITMATGGKKKDRPVVKPPSLARETVNPKLKKAPRAAEGMWEPDPEPLPEAKPVPPVTQPPPAPPKPAVATPPPQPAPVQPVTAAPPPPKPAAPAPQPATAPKPAPVQPVAAAPPPRPAAPQPAAAAPTAKPQASGTPPTPGPDPRMLNRKRVQDLVTINDALKAYHARHGAFPRADGLAGANERGATWIPGLSPDFLQATPVDPMHGPATQYVYASDGANYKLLALGVSLLGSPNVEVLGIKIDPTRKPTPENAAFGFWTPAFAGA